MLGNDQSEETGSLDSLDHRKDYIAHLLSYVDRSALKPLKIVTNAGHGGAGIAIDELAPHLPFEFVSIHHAPDGHFPEGVPNPLLVKIERQPLTPSKRPALILASLGMEILIVVSFSIRTDDLLRATTWSVFWPVHS